MPTEPEESPIKAERAAATKAECAAATKAECAAAQRAAKRAELEAAALRANLFRRKTQTRARQMPAPEADKPCR